MQLHLPDGPTPVHMFRLRQNTKQHYHWDPGIQNVVLQTDQPLLSSDQLCPAARIHHTQMCTHACRYANNNQNQAAAVNLRVSGGDMGGLRGRGVRKSMEGGKGRGKWYNYILIEFILKYFFKKRIHHLICRHSLIEGGGGGWFGFLLEIPRFQGPSQIICVQFYLNCTWHHGCQRRY